MKPFKLSYKTRTLAVTSLGIRFILLMIVVGIAAINTGNNLLYLILAMMLSLILISGILSEACLHRLRYRRSVPAMVFAGQPITISLLIFNDKKRIPSFSLHVNDSLEGFSEGTLRGIYFFKLAHSTCQERAYTLFFSRRGVYPFLGMKFSTRFPFGLFLKTRHEEEPVPAELVVFPRTFRVSSTWRERERVGDPLAFKRGHGISLYQFRPYLPGDDARSIHWKISAKKNKLIVREFEEEEEKKIAIGLSNTLNVIPSAEFRERFERGIELAASFSRHYLEKGYQVSFFTPVEEIPFGKGWLHLKEILTFLSFLKIHQGPVPAARPETGYSAPTLFISPFYPVGAGSRPCLKVFNPDDLNALTDGEPL